jgi:poly(A) polymerase
LDNKVTGEPGLSYSRGLELSLSHAFEAAGHELFVVGGAVRDELLALPTPDLDFATDALPEETVEILRSIPQAAIYRVGEKFGTIGLVAGGARAEITTYRSGETYTPESRKPMVHFGRTLDEDLSRRDFTINALARGAMMQEIIDPYGGQIDLSRRILRAVGNPPERFREDPLRLLRGVRFASRLGLDIEPITWSAMVSAAPALDRISRERVAMELNNMLMGENPRRAMELLRDSGLLAVAVPPLIRLTQMPDHGPSHPLSLWEHTMRVLEGVPPDEIVRWAALFHDVAKPDTRSFDANGRIRFYKHEDVGGSLARQTLTSLKFSRDLVDSVATLVETHMQLHSYSSAWSDGAVRRLEERLGPNFERAMQLARADAAGHTEGPVWNAPKFDALERRLKRLREEVPEVRSPLNGEELMEHYGRGPGPWIADVKAALAEMVFEGTLPPDGGDAAWREADRLVKELKS